MFFMLYSTLLYKFIIKSNSFTCYKLKHFCVFYIDILIEFFKNIYFTKNNLYIYKYILWIFVLK